MPGAIIQIVANAGAVQNRWLETEPQITYFKKIYRRHTPFALELVPVTLHNPVDFGQHATATLLPGGDLMYRVMFTFDIPRIVAAFLNPKATDISLLITNATLADTIIYNQLFQLSSNSSQTQTDAIVNLIDTTLASYTTEKEQRLQITLDLNAFASFLGPLQIPNQVPYQPSYYNPQNLPIPVPQPPTLTQLDQETGLTYDFVQLKMDLANIWLKQKNQYYLIYQLLTYLYESQLYIINSIPLVNTNILQNIVLYASTFFNFIPSREILEMFYLKNQSFAVVTGQSSNSLIQAFNIVLEADFNSIINNMPTYLLYNQIFSPTTSTPQINNPDLTITALQPDTYVLLENLTFIYNNNYSNFPQVQDEFYDYGTGFYYMLNTFNTLTRIIDNVMTTVPVVIIKPFLTVPPAEFLSNFTFPPDIYSTDPTFDSQLSSQYYATFTDSNFEEQFLLKLNLKTTDPIIGVPPSLLHSSDPINNQNYLYSNKVINAYLTIFNDSARFMFNTIQKNVDTVYEFYRNFQFQTNPAGIFLETRNLGFQSYSVGSINTNRAASGFNYGYVFPTQGFTDNNPLRINNVVCLNYWFFSFFAYLDRFNPVNYANYLFGNGIVSGYTPYKLDANAILFFTSLLQLLKLNVDNYIEESAYLVNDLYENAPSAFAGDTMKNYVPMAPATTINNININTTLFGTTFVFYRNHSRSIMEMFQFIFFFCDNVTLAQINTYLSLSIQPLSANDEATTRRLVKLLYYKFLQYFMDKYDSFGFEQPANYSTNAYNVFGTDNQIVGQYVTYFMIDGTAIQPNLDPSQQQLSVDVIAQQQMEMYFVVEMIHMRAIEKFYHDSLFNTDLIKAQVGQTTYELIQLVINVILANDDFPIDPNVYAKLPDPVRSYYDDLYQHNAVRGLPDNLYYATFNTNRYIGQPYTNTPYQSRFFGMVNPPIAPFDPLPPTNPYGVNPTYYDNKQVSTDSIPPNPNEILQQHIKINWLNTPQTPYKTQTASPAYELYNIDYYRIKASIFNQPDIVIPPNIIFIDQYQANLLQLLRLTQRLSSTYLTSYDYNLNYRLWALLYFVISQTSPTATYDHPINNPLNSVPPGTPYIIFLAEYRTFMFAYFFASFVPGFLQTIDFFGEAINCINEMITKFNDGIRITIPSVPQEPTYTATDLAQCNLYAYNQILTAPTSVTDNLTDKFLIMRNNFLSQYWWYIKYESSITTIYNFNTYQDNLSFVNMNTLVSSFMVPINFNNIDLTPITSASSFVYIYPDLFQAQIQQIINLQTTMDDFSLTVLMLITNFFAPETTPRLTVNDIYDLINITFFSTEAIYAYSLNHRGVYEYLISILAIYQPLLLDKTTLFNEIGNYVLTIPPTAFMVSADVVTIANMAASFGIDFNDYSNYLNTVIVPLFNAATNAVVSGTYPFNRLVVISVTLNNDLDYFFLKWRIGATGITLGVTLFKSYIISNIFTPTFAAANPTLQSYFGFISNSIYGYIYTYLTYAAANIVPPISSINPIDLYTKYDLSADQGIISVQYNAFGALGNVLSYFMDYVWDWTMTVLERNPLNLVNDFGYSERFSISVNQIHLNTMGAINMDLAELEADYQLFLQEQATTAQAAADQAAIQAYFKAKQLQSVLNAIAAAKAAAEDPPHLSNPSTDPVYPVSSYDYYFLKLSERTEIIDFVITVAQQGIVLVDTYYTQLFNLRNQLYNIFYRNIKAKAAWVRKLAHFLVKEVSLTIGDQSGDVHYSDWLEIFHEISKMPGSEPGYKKMIGHREDLIVYDDKIKNKYTIVMPFIFYFNRNIICSIPLIASLNTPYEISFTLRELSEVTFKEQFSDWVDPALYESMGNIINPNALAPFVPKITNTRLMCEYIYLTTEERYVFVNRILEYMIEETQFDEGFNVSDNNLQPIYLIGSGTKTVATVVNGTPTVTTIFDPVQGVYVTQDELDLIGPNDFTLLPRDDHILVPYTDRTGVTKLLAQLAPLPGVDPNIHFKQIVRFYKFGNPTELLTVVAQPDFHIQPTYRVDEKSYFFGEIQWDNFSLYSYFDLSAIYDAKAAYYETTKAKFNDVNDSTFGFVNVINQLINIYQNGGTIDVQPSSGVDQWIAENLTYFVQTLYRIRDQFLAYMGVFVDVENTVRLVENLLMLNLSYDIWQDFFLFQLVDDVYGIVGVPPPTQTEVITAYSGLIANFDITNFLMTRDIFRLGLMELLIGTVEISAIDSAINTVYPKYNEVEIKMLSSMIINLFNLNGLSYNLLNIIDYFYNFYLTTPAPVSAILLMAQTINNVIQNLPSNETAIFNTNLIFFLNYKEIIYQLFPISPTYDPFTDYLTLISDFTIYVVSYKMNQMFNIIWNNFLVTLINYQTAMKPNPRINPVRGGYLSFNSYNFTPPTANHLWWSEVPAYRYTNHTPSTGINLYSWSLGPLCSQPMGAANLSKIDEFTGTYNLHPLISNTYPATLSTTVLGMNFLRYMSGLAGKTWYYSSKKIE